MEKEEIQREILSERLRILREEEIEKSELEGTRPIPGFLRKETEYQRPSRNFDKGDHYRWTLQVPHPFVWPDWMKVGATVVLKSDEREIQGILSHIGEETIGAELLLSSITFEDIWAIGPRISLPTYELYYSVLDSLLSGKWEKTLGKITNFWNKEISILEDPAIRILVGPPGTGKTKNLLDMARDRIASGSQVLALAPNNYAVDNLVEKSLELGLRPLRLGSSPKIRESVRSFTMSDLLEDREISKTLGSWKKDLEKLYKSIGDYDPNLSSSRKEKRRVMQAEAQELRKLIQKTLQSERRLIFEESELVCGTFASTKEMPFRKEYSLVVVDEATQVLDIASYLAIDLGEEVVFAGDPKQLPPLYKSDPKKKSFLEVSIDRCHPSRIQFLTEQYRMPMALLSFSNEVFYESKLHSHIPELDLGDVIFRKNLIFLDTAGSSSSEVEENASYFNSLEIDFISQIAKEVKNLGSLAILSPYQAQISKFKSHTELSKINSILQSIDAFQGREADVVILSMVRSNDRGEVGFSLDPRRFNVAITRAKKLCVVVGDSSTLAQNSLFARFLEHVGKSGEVRSVFEWEGDW